MRRPRMRRPSLAPARPGSAAPTPTESQEQQALIAWAARSRGRFIVAPGVSALDYLHAIPNGGDRHPATAGRLKAEGVKPGVPDLCLAWPCGPWHGLYLELKRAKGGRTSPEQKDWIHRLRIAGYRVDIAHGFEDARQMIEEYLRDCRVTEVAA